MAKFLDFAAVGKTDWKNPNLDYKNKLWLGAAVGAVLVLILVFTPWISLSSTVADGEITANGSLLGIGTAYGIFALIGAVVALYGVLYRQLGFAIVGAGFALLMVLIFFMAKDGIEVDTVVKGFGHTKTRTFTITEFNKETSEAAKYSDDLKSTVSSIVPLFVLIGAALSAVCSYLLFKKENK